MTSILLVDDDDDFRAMLKQLLERENYLVISAKNGEIALSTLSQVIPNMVITDLIMPEKDGLELISELRKTHLNLKLIAISGGGLLVDPEQYLDIAKKMGADMTFTKPLDRAKFISAIGTLLSD